MSSGIQKFIADWSGNAAGEMATAQQHFLELCDALEVPRPTPQEQEDLTFRFEMPVKVLVRQNQKSSTERIDVYKETTSSGRTSRVPKRRAARRGTVGEALPRI